MEPAPDRRTVILRGLRCLCPACGKGRVFVRGFTSAESCPSCGFRLERGPGHWIGGSEINLIVTYPVCVALFVVPAFLTGGSWAMAAAGGLVACVMAVAIHRPARGLFFALDYLIEPLWESGDADGDGRSGGDPGEPAAPRPGGGGARRPGVLTLPLPEPARGPAAEADAPWTPDSVRT